MSIIHITGSGYTEQNDQDNWAAEYLARNLNLHKELDILDHPDGSVTKAKLSSALQRDIDNTADTADTALDLAGDNEAAIKELKSRLTSDEQSAAETKKTADNAEKQSGYALGTAMSNSKNIGALSELKTSDKTNLVSAINELKGIDDSLFLENVRIFGTIDNAQTAADNAQTTAENAQTAADKAQQTADSIKRQYDTTDAIALSAYNSAQEAKDIADIKADKEDKYGGFTGGHSSQNNGRGVAVGYNAHAYGGVAVGDEATAQGGNGIAIGRHSNTGAAMAIGDYAVAMLAKGMQFGKGINNEEGTVQFWDWQLFNADGNIPLERLTLLFDKVMESMESLAEISGDYVIEPVVEGVTEKFTLTSSWTMLKYSTTFLTKEISLDVKYRLFAGDTGLTDSIIDDSVPTVTAAGGFEGDNITIVIYSHTTELFRAKLKTVSIGNKKVGKLIRI